MGKIYKNGKRAASNGNQSEIPTVNCTKDKCVIGGYQNFSLSKEAINLPGKYRNKFQYIQTFLQNAKDCSSVTDLGASNGVVSFSAIQAGYDPVYALDHDRDCIKLLKTVKENFDYDALIPVEYSFGDEHQKTDIVIMGALIHWVYSCTALYGNFDAISSYLRGITGTYLIIEWVGPADPAIKFFKHTSFNKQVIKEPYTRVNFINSLKRYFTGVNKVLSVVGTRELYLCEI